MKHKILCTDGFAEAGLTELKKSASLDVVFERSLSHEDLIKKVPSFDGLIVRSASTVSRDVIEAGKNLKIVVRAGVGTDNIDIGAATKHGVLVANAPAGNATSAAELTFAMILSLARWIPQAASSMAEGEWEKKKFQGVELAGKTVGIIGLGRIGRAVAKRAIAFNMNIVGFDPFISREQLESLGVEHLPKEDIFKKADFITFHTPLTDETKNMVTLDELKTMKKTAYLVNCARGGIINEHDLAVALKEGLIAGAALDVFTKEPYKEEIFRKLENCITTPHLGASTHDAQEAVAIEAALVVTKFFDEGLSINALNKLSN
ncbi:MAG: hypothetical protein COV46_01780 [Deltaproteobacteria bacterium CG11_big_fil_rev_8_21_14_0_20_49_13]|nr:MAG: hypothetical protein COV46_01780 [Deltaproteobacteria bacterium CG11_big_fil_rev_8_21_14_0_20_49_13]